MMYDDKRMLRRLKREVKRRGNKQLRRFLKDVDANPDQFNYGRNQSQTMNQADQDDDRRTE